MTDISGLPLYLSPSVTGLAVEGIDLEQARKAILLNSDTEGILYGPGFSPTGISYISGSRPRLEKIAATLERVTPTESAKAAADWMFHTIRHPYLTRLIPKNRAMTEEEIIDSGAGWCNEQARVFVALCEVMRIPGRMCFLTRRNGRCGHVTAEVYLDGKWAWFDITFGVRVELPDGRLAAAGELSGAYRELATTAYRPELERCERLYIPEIENEPGWRSSERVKPEAGGDLLHRVGICNYIIDGAEAL